MPQHEALSVYIPKPNIFYVLYPSRSKEVELLVVPRRIGGSLAKLRTRTRGGLGFGCWDGGGGRGDKGEVRA